MWSWDMKCLVEKEWERSKLNNLQVEMKVRGSHQGSHPIKARAPNAPRDVICNGTTASISMKDQPHSSVIEVRGPGLGRYLDCHGRPFW